MLVYGCSYIYLFMKGRLSHISDTNYDGLGFVSNSEKKLFFFTHYSYIMTSRYKRYITYGIRA